MIAKKIKKDLDWTEKVINSCKTQDQLNVAMNCLNNFKKKWENEPIIEDFEVISGLNFACNRLKTSIFWSKMNIFKKNVDIYCKN